MISHINIIMSQRHRVTPKLLHTVTHSALNELQVFLFVKIVEQLLAKVQ